MATTLYDQARDPQPLPAHWVADQLADALTAAIDALEHPDDLRGRIHALAKAKVWLVAYEDWQGKR